MTRLLEDRSLVAVERSALRTPPWTVVADEGDVPAAVEATGLPVMLKALVPVGGRQKGGMVRRAESAGEARAQVADMLGETFRGFPVARVLVAAAVDIRREFFLSIAFDAQGRGPRLTFAAEGGVDIEELARTRPDRLVRHVVDISRGLSGAEAADVAEAAGLADPHRTALAEALGQAYRCFRALDASLVEINPLVLTGEGETLAASAVVVVDDQAAFRQQEWLDGDDVPPNNGRRPLTGLERTIREIDLSDSPVRTIRFNEFDDGDIALMVTGGGAGLTALDAMHRAGCRPATSFDIKIGQIEEKMYRATMAVLSRPGLNGLLAGANYANFTGVDIKVRGVVRALRDAGVDARRFPVVLRFCGANQEEAAELAGSIPGLEYLDDHHTLEQAVDRLAERVRGASS